MIKNLITFAVLKHYVANYADKALKYMYSDNIVIFQKKIKLQLNKYVLNNYGPFSLISFEAIDFFV